jgi:hypothetical protein
MKLRTIFIALSACLMLSSCGLFHHDNHSSDRDHKRFSEQGSNH